MQCSIPSGTDSSSWVKYNNLMAGRDECFTSSGQIRPHWQPLFDQFSGASSQELESMEQDVWQHLRRNGVSYNIEGENEPESRPWPLDPIPIVYSEEEWSTIEKGLVQRTQLLELILQDLYGPRNLIREGILPQELIYRHSKFLRACDQIIPASGQFLPFYAANLARDDKGNFWVVNNYTEAPHGCGYALENRTVIVKTLPGPFAKCHVRRQADFFRAFKKNLIAQSKRVKSPRIVLLTPGPEAASYFEHAYLASYLGITLVLSGDLTVRRGKVWLKALEGLQRVDVIFRFFSGAHLDPLALPPAVAGAPRGVPGLLDAARQGQVAIVNPPGSGVLENPGLYPYLSRISRHLLGEDLLLPHIASWWCGGKKELAYVLEKLPTLVIKSLSRKDRFDTTFGTTLSTKELAVLARAHSGRPFPLRCARAGPLLQLSND